MIYTCDSIKELFEFATVKSVDAGIEFNENNMYIDTIILDANQTNFDLGLKIGRGNLMVTPRVISISTDAGQIEIHRFNEMEIDISDNKVESITILLDKGVVLSLNDVYAHR